MPIVYCPNCAKKTRAPDSAIGKRGQCPACQAWMRIPERDEAPPRNQNADPILDTPPSPPLPSPPSPNEHRKATAVVPLPPNASGMLICVIVYMGATILDIIAIVSQERGVDLALTAVCLCALVTLAVFTAIFIYRAWACLPARAQQTSPAMAVGLMFVPLFNCYWAFIAIRGLAARTIEQTRETSLLGLATALSVLFVVCQIMVFLPVIGSVGMAALIVVLCLWAVRQETATAVLTGNAKPASKGLAIGALATTAACALLMIGAVLFSKSAPANATSQATSGRDMDSFRNYSSPARTPQKCWGCNGSGTSSNICTYCDGTGIKNGRKCGLCNGMKFEKCMTCNGKGYLGY